MCQWEKTDHYILCLWTCRLEVQQSGAIGHHIAMCQHHALWCTRCSGSVAYGGQVRRCWRLKISQCNANTATTVYAHDCDAPKADIRLRRLHDPVPPALRMPWRARLCCCQQRSDQRWVAPSSPGKPTRDTYLCTQVVLQASERRHTAPRCACSKYPCLLVALSLTSHTIIRISVCPTMNAHASAPNVSYNGTMTLLCVYVAISEMIH